MSRALEKSFTCRVCGAQFFKAARYAYYCDSCRSKVRSMDVMRSRAKRNPNVLIGVGSGGHQKGKDNHHFIDGRTDYRGAYQRANPKNQRCEVCNSTRNLVIHHIDKNRKNAAPCNLIMLCRSCHAQVHRLTRSLGNIPMVDKED